MKAEQRKELERNVLAEKIGNIGQVFKNRPTNTVYAVLGVLLVTVIVYSAFRYFRARSLREDSARWEKLETTASVPELREFIKNNQGTTAARTARYMLARALLDRGIHNLGSRGLFTEDPKNPRTNHAQAIEDLKEARQLYEELIPQSKGMPNLIQEALMNRARVEESLSGTDQGSLDKAIELYNQLAREYPDSPLAEAAKKQAEKIANNKAEVQQFYEGLNKQAQ